MKNNCTKNYGVTYDSYITSLGVTHLKKRNHQGNVFIDGKYHSAVVYDGAPDASVVAHNVHPAVVFAYMNPNNGATFGWEMFFPRTVISSIFRAEFWFANMKISSRDANVFFNYPVECELSIINITKQSLFDELFIGRK
ncbi:hypothetical protein Tcan_17725 [Toxocara canis]|uniref:Uncharacterized protein n=1 Tax=Toxocara canis TaxID=6265 RepID=A0A0B2VXP0_TOXCA|nr:hypothetical protein Tcan_17725 [Toxocara canis]